MWMLLIGNLLVGGSSFLLTRRFFGYLSKPDFLLTWFIFFFSQIIAIGLCLGVAGKLYLANIIILTLIIFLITFKTCLTPRRPFYIDLSDFDFVWRSRLLITAVSIFLGFFLIKTWINLVNPPVCPDSLQYHLAFPATWIRNANLNNPIVIFGSRPTSAEMTALTYYPINAELFFFWPMLPLRNAFLADIGQVPFYFLGILAIYSILRKLAIKKETALLAGILWALIPNVFKQIRTGSQIDVICAVLFLLVVNNLLLMKEKLNFKTAALLGVSSGIFIGTKVLNIFWFMAIIPLFVYFALRHLKEKTAAKFGLSVMVMSLLAFFYGSFSYIRTFFITGNPFYPVSLTLFGKSIFPGIIDKVSFSKIFVSWEEFSLRNMFFGEGLGLQFLAFIFPGTIAPLIFFRAFKKRIQGPISYFWLFFIPAFMFFMYLFYIKAYWIRYLFPYLGMGLICSVIFLDRFKWGRKYITIVGFLSLISSAAELAHRQELIISLVASFLLFFGLLWLKNNLGIKFKNTLSWKTLLISLLAIFCLVNFLNEKYNQEEFFRYPLLFKGKEAGERDIAFSWKWLNENTGEGKRIAYTGRNEFYPLFGTKLKNGVQYISVNDKPNQPHYYLDGLYRKEKKYLSWVRNLELAKIDYLFIALPYPINNESDNPEEFPIEDKWAKENPDKFKLVFSNTKARIYSFLDNSRLKPYAAY